MIRPAELIQRKRDGEELADEKIAELVLGYARGEVPDYQMAAFAMAVYFRGLSTRETFALTDAMVRTVISYAMTPPDRPVAHVARDLARILTVALTGKEANPR